MMGKCRKTKRKNNEDEEKEKEKKEVNFKKVFWCVKSSSLLK